MNFNLIHVENLLNKIEKFYKKFYINKLIKGVFTSLGIVLAVFLLFNVVFYYFDISKILRFGLFYTLVLVLIISLWYWVLVPILMLLKIKQGISYTEASRYIGNHYNEIDDSLLNAVQLYFSENKGSLASAAIEGVSKNFENIDFARAVPTLGSDKRVFWLFTPFLVFIFMYLVKSDVIFEGSNRLYNYETDFSNIAPFQFVVENQEFNVYEGSDVELDVTLMGNALPEFVEVFINGVRYKTLGNQNSFVYQLKNVSNDLEYYFLADGYTSELFTITLVNKPKITEISTTLSYPDYLKLETKSFVNPSVVTVYSGTISKWNAGTEDVVGLRVTFNDSIDLTCDVNNRNYSFLLDDYGSGSLKFYVSGKMGKEILAFETDVILIEDDFPFIQVESINEGFKVFEGFIQDDFGFYDLKVYMDNGDDVKFKSINISHKDLTCNFYFKVPELDSTFYGSIWFEVRDNDVLNGYKNRKSKVFYVHKVITENLNEQSERIKDDLKNVLNNSKEVSKELKDLQKELIKKSELSWSDKNKLQKTINKQSQVNANVEKLKRDLDSHNKDLQKQEDLSQSIQDKQEQLNDLLEKLLDDENKKLLEELQKMLDEMDKDKLSEQLKQLQQNQEKFEEELERDLEIFKQMEVEKKMNEVLSELDSLSKDQKSLEQKNESKELSLDENTKKQEELNKRFEEVAKEINEIDSLNKELSDPNDFDKKEEQQEQVKKEMEDAKESSESGDRKKSSESQKKASEELDEMKEQMEMSMAMASSDQEGEDLESLRKILENLLVVSFEQEEVIQSVKTVSAQDPLVVKLTQEQLELLDNSGMIRDSLLALSARVPQIESIVTKELDGMNDNMELSIEELKERNLGKASLFEQKALTSINNLAVLLDEIIQQMQEQQKNKNKGTGSCSKPGEGKPNPSMGDSKKKQEELAKKMKAMKKKMEEGEMPGKMNPGSVGKGMSMEIAKMAAEQGQIREQIRKMRDELQKQGNLGGAGELKKLEELLDKNEEDLINMKLDQEFLSRQQDIEVKMLEAENASREREKDQKRESNSALNISDDSDKKMEEYIRKKEQELELIRLANPKFNSYYKSKVGSYNFK